MGFFILGLTANLAAEPVTGDIVIPLLAVHVGNFPIIATFIAGIIAIGGEGMLCFQPDLRTVQALLPVLLVVFLPHSIIHMGNIGVYPADSTNRFAAIFQLVVSNGNSGAAIVTGFPMGMGIAGPVPYFVILFDTLVTGFTFLRMNFIINVAPFGVLVLVGCGDIHLSGGAALITFLGFSTLTLTRWLTKDLVAAPMVTLFVFLAT